jgi:GDP-L-fucose synthase
LKIYVAGHRGLVGSAIVRHIENRPHHTWIGKTRNELNLLNRETVFEFLTKEKPDAVIVAAAKVGGILANANNPVEFLSENIQISTNLLDGAHFAKIERLVFLGSSCVYPKLSQQPIKEEYLLTGELEKTNEAYAIAKIAAIKLIQGYRTQFRHRWISAMPTNVYGPRDNFDPISSHVLPALIRKFDDAKLSGASKVTLWGSGTPRREFLHSDDLADAVIFLLENYDGDVPMNIGFGEDTSILELAALVSGVVGFRGETIWDTSKPDGTPKKLLDSSRIASLGWKPSIKLKQGIEETYSWYAKNRP